MNINLKNKKRIGIIGTGYVSKGLVLFLNKHKDDIDDIDDISVSMILTRRSKQDCIDYPYHELLTNSHYQLFDNSDILIECSGDVIYATRVIEQALSVNLPVITMNSEFHVTCGSFYVNKGIITESEGDQPGCLATFKENVTQMGFKPLVYRNIKGFLNHDPTLQEMEYWAKKQGISLNKVISFTDGTKIQIEQA